MGRAGEAKVLAKEPEGKFDVVSASDVPLEGALPLLCHSVLRALLRRTRFGTGGDTPRPLTEAEIEQYPKDYALAAKRFVEEAGGDGVEIQSVPPLLSLPLVLILNANLRFTAQQTVTS